MDMAKKASSRRYTGKEKLQKAETERAMPRQFTVFICAEDETEEGTIAIPEGMTPEEAYDTLIGMAHVFADLVPGFMEYAGRSVKKIRREMAEEEGEEECE